MGRVRVRYGRHFKSSWQVTAAAFESYLRSQRPTWAPSLVFPTAILVLLTALRRWKRSLEIHCGLQPLIDFTQKLRRQSADPFGHLGPVQRGHLMADGEARLG